MWVKIEIFASDQNLIFLPSKIAPQARTTKVSFGRLTADVRIRCADGLELNEDSSYEHPGRLRMSDRLANALLIREEPLYRLRISEDGILIGPVIGLLLGIHTHRYNPAHMEKYSDRFGVYGRVGGLIYAFSPRSVNWEKNTAYGLFYNIVTSAWEYGCFPLPDVIYRRNFHSDPEYIRRLIEITGGRLFNSYRFTKLELFNLFSSNRDFKAYLPPTELSLNFNQVRRFIDRYAKCILKPIDLSRGRGICIIEKHDDVYKVSDYRYKYPIISFLHDITSLEDFFAINPGFFSKYIIQQYLQLARVGDSLFDIRVVMQKREDHTWGCTGIECRVSSSNFHLTNISRGGYALTLEEALQQSFTKDYEGIHKKIEELCQKFCSYMDTLDGHFAEYGIDVAVDTDKNLWFIEANVFPSFKGFKKLDYKTYLNIRYAPLLYALSLTPFSDGQ